MKSIKFIDLFAGIGGTRIGFENACKINSINTKCVFTSEIKDYAVKAYKDNFKDDAVYGDITQIPSDKIPDFDFLLAGFPCQPFSSAGSRNGFADTRGTLFFEIERILRDKKPYGFLLENVEGLVNHDKVNKRDLTGRTLSIILDSLKALGYKVNWKLIDASMHGIPQKRRRIYIVGTKDKKIDLDNFPFLKSKITDILEKNKELLETPFIKRLLNHFSVKELEGKAIKDKRGGISNIHSWEIEMKGKTSEIQRELLNNLLKERRKKHWAEKKQIVWMDGMSLTLDEIYTFFNKISKSELKSELDDLVEKKYLRFEPPKNIVEEDLGNGRIRKFRKLDYNKESGYNIVAGKLSFPISKVLDSNSVSPTLVAMDVDKIAVVDGNGLRQLTIREGLRLFGFPEDYVLNTNYKDSFDLLGNTVVVKIVEMVSERIVSQAITTLD